VCGEAAAPGASRASTACEFVRLDEPSWDKVCALGPDRGPGLDRVGEVVVVVSANAGLAVTARIVMKRRYDFMFTSNLDMHHNQSVLAGVAGAGTIRCEGGSADDHQSAHDQQ
jgi:hypothetical protein